MLLAIEVGNTTTVLAVPAIGGGWAPYWRLSSDRTLTADDWSAKLGSLAHSAQFDLADIDALAISSVVPAISSTLVQWSQSSLGVQPLVVSHRLDLGIRLDIDVPAELGADRICNVVAAWTRSSSAAIVVDCGTATKIEALSGDGAYIGGSIAVGLSLSLEALAGRAAQLFSVPLQSPARVIGKNTVDHVQSGIVYGHALMIEGLIASFRRDMGGADLVFLTGGYSGILAPLLPSVTEHLPELTLDGLRIVHARNSEFR